MNTIRHYSARAKIHLHGSGTAEIVFSGLIDARSLAAMHPQARAYAKGATGWVLDFSGAALMLPNGPVEGLSDLSDMPVAVIAPAGFNGLSIGRASGVICAVFAPAQIQIALLWLERQKPKVFQELPGSHRYTPARA